MSVSIQSLPSIKSYRPKFHSYARVCGLGRASFWRALGFPNLARARAVYQAQLAAARAAHAQLPAHTDDSGDWRKAGRWD